jgi:WW domain-containing oxidoreductase
MSPGCIFLHLCCKLLYRLGARGVQAVAADPGAVRTNIYNNSPKLGKGFIKTMIDNCYAPPEDGAQVS